MSRLHRAIKTSGLMLYCRITQSQRATKVWRYLSDKAHDALCMIGIHDWRYASNYRRKGRISSARCQYCERRLWEDAK